MICLHTTVPVDDHQIAMAKPVISTDPCSKLRNKKTPSSPNRIPDCERSRSAMIDVFLLIAVIAACGYLLFPYTILLIASSIEFIEEAVLVLREEVFDAPLIYGCLGLSILYAAIAAVAIMICTGRKCGKPGCRGLRKAAEFDIQLETEECVKNSSIGLLKNGGVKRGLFELPRDHHRELEAELKKMAPVNGRAVLVFRARCGCSIGRMEVPGAKKLRKVKNLVDKYNTQLYQRSNLCRFVFPPELSTFGIESKHRLKLVVTCSNHSYSVLVMTSLMALPYGMSETRSLLVITFEAAPHMLQMPLLVVPSDNAALMFDPSASVNPRRHQYVNTSFLWKWRYRCSQVSL